MVVAPDLFVVRGFQLKGGIFEPVQEARNDQGTLVFLSDVVGLELQGKGESLRWIDPRTGKVLPFPQELYDEVDEEKHRAEAAEAEVKRLRLEIERLRGKDYPGFFGSLGRRGDLFAGCGVLGPF